MDFTSLVLGLICGGAVASAILLYRQRDTAANTARLQAELAAAKSQVDDKLTNVLQKLTQDSMVATNQQFLQLADAKMKEGAQKSQTDLTALLSPLKVQLEQLTQQQQAMEKNRAGAYEGLTQQILSLRDETGKLSRALRAPQTRGRWGEVQLQRLIELAGMQPHAEFSLQNSFSTDDGQKEGRLRPDCIISLPGGKRVVIDVKTPLLHYMEAEEATDEAVQREAMKNYARSVKTHIAQLSSKEYYKQLDQVPDYVILFLPGEHFLSAALRENQDLFEEALTKNVILASTSTLMILMKAYVYAWQQETIVENAQKVTLLGRQMFERLSKLTDVFGTLGQHIFRSMKSYNEAMGSFETRVLVSARKFGELGITADTLPEAAKIEEISPRRLAVDDDSDNDGGAEILQLKAE